MIGYITVKTPTAMPPKRPPVPLQPKLSMAEEAARIRRRHRREFGHHITRPASDEHNQRLKAEADARRNEDAAQILAIISEQERCMSDLKRIMRKGREHIREALVQLRDQGLAHYGRTGRLTVWRPGPAK